MKAIIKERIEQIKQGIIPEGYKKIEIGIIPEDWEIRELGELIELLQSGLSRRLNIENIGLPVLRSNNLIDGKVDIKDLKYWYLDDPQGAKTENYYLKKGDLLVNFINSLAQIGKVAIYNNEVDSEVIFTTNIMRLRVNERAKSSYLLYYFNLKEYNDYIQSITKPAVNQASFTTSDFKKFNLKLPTLKEQEKIASILTKWDSLIEQQEKLIEEKRMSAKIFQANLLYGRKRFKCFNDSNEVYKSRVGTLTNDKSWQITKIKNAFETVSIRNCGSEELLAVTQDKGVIPRNMLDGNVTMLEGTEDNYKLVEKGNFIISLRSFQGGLEYSEYRGIVSPAYTVIKPKISIDDTYFKYLFKNLDFIKRMSSAVVGIRDGKQINFRDFGELFIQVPPIKEQEKISQFLSKLDEEILLQEEKLNLLKEEKKILMQLLLTGILRV